MRIAHLCHYYRSELEGGVQSYVSGLVRHQRAAGHDVRVLTGALDLERGPVDLDGEHEGTEVRTLFRGPEDRFSGDLGSAAMGMRISSWLEDVRPELCHVHHWQALSNDVVRRCRSAGARVVLTLHDLFSTCPRFFRMRRPPELCRADLPLSECARCVHQDLGTLEVTEIEALLADRHRELQEELEAADASVIQSRAMKERHEAVPFFAHRGLEVLPIGVLREDLRPCPAPTRLPGRLRIAHWAGVDPRKGLHILVEALAGSDRVREFELHIYGTSEDPEYLRQLRETTGHLQVVWHGSFRDDDALRGIARSTDLAVFPSLEEPYGLAQDEAMLLGMALVISDRGAPPERIGTRGLVVPFAKDPRGALREALEQLLDNPQRIEQLRQGDCRARSIRDHVPELMALYQRVLDRGD